VNESVRCRLAFNRLSIHNETFFTDVKFHLFIDESGNFDPAEKPASVVGGVCGRNGSESWKTKLLQCVDAFNKTTGTTFNYEKDLHCGPLLDSKQLHRHTHPERRAFADAIFSEVRTHSLFRFIARHPRNLWVFSRQAAYGLNLLAALRVALDHLAASEPAVSEVEIVIATRSVGETQIGGVSAPGKKYIDDLLPHLAAQLTAGSSPGSQLAKRLGASLSFRGVSASKQSDFASLAAADFACGQLRFGTSDPGALCASPLSEIEVLGDWERFFTTSAQQLRARGQYSAAAVILRENLPFDPHPPTEWKHLLAALRQEPDFERLARELPSLVSQARHLIAIRARQAGALPAAKLLLNELCQLARTALRNAGDEAGRRRVWAEMLLDALAEKCACLNHSGDTEEQEALLAEHSDVLREHADVVVRDFVADRRRRLELRNRLLNRLFNDYRFSDVISDIEPEVNRLAEQLDQENARRRDEGQPRIERDELLGKLQGSVGQACAFLAATDPSWTDHAHEWLKRSQEHFPVGSKYFAMTVNYRATLAWQSGDLTAGCALLATQPGLAAAGHPTEFCARWPDLAGSLAARPFAAVNLLRLAALAGEKGAVIAAEHVAAAENALAVPAADAHPHEQIAKWLAYLWLLAGKAAAALPLCQRGLAICYAGDFTLRTIGLSILALDIAARNMLRQTVKPQLEDLDRRANGLVQESPAFGSFLSARGGPKNIRALTLCGPDALAKITRLGPFSYA
jgi:hypothetical protein